MRIIISASARKDLDFVDKVIARRIIRKLEEFEGTSNPLSLARMLKQDSEGTHRFRIGDWRAKFVIEKETILIRRIKHRSDAYR